MIIENIIYFLKKKRYNLKGINFKSYDRSIYLTRNLLNANLSIYNGKYFIPIYVKHNMLNLIVSSFIFTKSIYIKKIIKKYKKKKKKKKKGKN